MLALGVLSTVLLATANPSLAKTNHHRTHAGVHTPYSARAEQGPFAAAPGYRVAPTFGNGYDAPAAVRPSVTWDPYGLRWDGGN